MTVQVSILVRSMDRDTLPRALASIAAQRNASIEVVVVAACGPGHRALPTRCGPHALRLVTSTRALPRAEAANLALDSAHGEWLGFLDDDDEFLPSHVGSLLATARAHPGVRLVHSQAAAIGPDGALRYVLGSPWQDFRCLDVGFIANAAALFHRSLVDEGVRFDPGFELLEDLDFFVQCAQRTRFAFHAAPTLRYHVTAGASGAGEDANFDPDRVAAAQSRLQAKWAALRARLEALPAARLDRAQQALREGRDAQACALLEALRAELPRDANVLNLLGVCRLRAGEREAARALFQAALESAPGAPTVLANLALLEAPRA